MQDFHYRAIDAEGSAADGVIRATDRLRAIESLQSERLLVLELGEPSFLTRAQSLLRKDISLFSASPKSVALPLLQRLGLLLGAGVTLDVSLQMIAEDAQGIAESKAAKSLLTRLRAGAHLADAMEKEPSYFPPFIVAVARAGEAGGTLAKSLSDLTQRLTRMRAARQTLQSALLYPATLLLTAFLAVGLILWVIVPQLEPILTEAGAQPPAAALMALELSHFVRENALLLLLMAMALAVTLVGATRSAYVRRWCDGRLLAAPILGRIIRQSETAKLARAVGALVEGGVPVSRALALCRGVMSNSRYAEAVEAAYSIVREGGSLTTALRRAALFEPPMIQMTEIGEKTGRLAAILGQTAEILEADSERRLNRALALLVPALTFGIGALVAGLIGSVMMVVTSINDLAQ